MVFPVEVSQECHQSTRVHFSPIVSQMWYGEGTRHKYENVTPLYTNIAKRNYTNGAGSNHGIERVKVQVQDLTVPQNQRVQKILLTLPTAGGGGFDRITVDMSSKNKKPETCEFQSRGFPPGEAKYCKNNVEEPLYENLNFLRTRLNYHKSENYDNFCDLRKCRDEFETTDIHFKNLLKETNLNKQLEPVVTQGTFEWPQPIGKSKVEGDLKNYENIPFGEERRRIIEGHKLKGISIQRSRISPSCPGTEKVKGVRSENGGGMALRNERVETGDNLQNGAGRSKVQVPKAQFPEIGENQPKSKSFKSKFGFLQRLSLKTFGFVNSSSEGERKEKMPKRKQKKSTGSLQSQEKLGKDADSADCEKLVRNLPILQVKNGECQKVTTRTTFVVEKEKASTLPSASRCLETDVSNIGIKGSTTPATSMPFLCPPTQFIGTDELSENVENILENLEDDIKSESQNTQMSKDHEKDSSSDKYNHKVQNDPPTLETRFIKLEKMRKADHSDMQKRLETPAGRKESLEIEQNGQRENNEGKGMRDVLAIAKSHSPSSLFLPTPMHQDGNVAKSGEAPSRPIGKPPIPPPRAFHSGSEVSRAKFLKSNGSYISGRMCAAELGARLDHFRFQLGRSREELSRADVDVSGMASAVRSCIHRSKGTVEPRVQSGPQCLLPDPKNWEKYLAGQEEWAELVAAASENLDRRGRGHHGFPPILETDLDAPNANGVDGDELGVNGGTGENIWLYHTGRGEVKEGKCKKARSLLSLPQKMSSPSPSMGPLGSLSLSVAPDDRARSMEFLLDDEKNAHLRPPENALQQQRDGRELSEHELRIQRSLNKLNVPEWYKKYGESSDKKREFGSGSGLAGGWAGLSSSKTSSLTSLQSTGRYPGSRTGFSSRVRSGTASTGGRSSRESLMSPSSTASASPSPYYERSSFTYGMPYSMTRFSSARMSCGASPASLSPSPSPVSGIGTSHSTPVSSGPMSRQSYTKQPYYGWRSQERLTSKSIYRTPAERLAADLLAHKSKPLSIAPGYEKENPEITVEHSVSPKDKHVVSSDLSLNNSEESSSHKSLNRVRSSIKEVSNAIVDYVNEAKPYDGANGGSSPRRGFVWLESSFVGTKPLDSPSTPDTPPVILPSSRLNAKRNVFQFDPKGPKLPSQLKSSSAKEEPRAPPPPPPRDSSNGQNGKQEDSPSNFTNSYLIRNVGCLLDSERVEERSNSSSVSSPTLEDILDSLLALRRPKKIRARPKGISPCQGRSSSASRAEEKKLPSPTVSDWQERMNQAPEDAALFLVSDDDFVSRVPETFPKPPSPFNSGSSASELQATADDVIARNRTMLLESENRGSRSTPPYTDPSLPLDPTREGEGSKSPLRQSDQNPEEDSSYSQTQQSIGIINNVIASLMNESSPLTARQRRVSFDLDVSDKEEKSSSRSKKDSEPLAGTIHCRNSKCGKTANGLEARREFKTCHNCNAFYCSRDCRRAHWDKHKKVCMQSRVGALCKQIINHVKDDSFVVGHLSAIAKRGVLAKGRGCVKLFFSSPDRAERFLSGGLPELPEPWYIPNGDVLPEEMGPSTFSELSEQVRNYNIDSRFVLYVSVCVVNEVPTSGAVKWEREMISRSSKIRLLIPRSFDENVAHHHASVPSHQLPDEPTEVFDTPGETDSEPQNDTLILKSVPAPPAHRLNSSDHRRMREISFANIQKHLNQRGVDLRRTYPDIYSRLSNYVENDEPFLPVTIHPRNTTTGKQFMCVIMPESSDYVDGIQLNSPHLNVETINISEQTYDYD